MTTITNAPKTSAIPTSHGYASSPLCRRTRHVMKAAYVTALGGAWNAIATNTVRPTSTIARFPFATPGHAAPRLFQMTHPALEASVRRALAL